jgi:hypothetical protein
MWLYKHHTSSDIIDLDHETGRWRPVDDSEKPRGARVLADLPVAGSYEDEGDRRYYCYWTPDSKFVFRTPDNKVLELYKKLPDGSVIELVPGLRCEIEQAKFHDGRVRQGVNEVRLLDAANNTLVSLTYDASKYLALYASDFTAASAVEDLSDWDFFVALKGAVEIFAERAHSGKVHLTVEQDGTANIQGARVAREDLIYCQSRHACPRSGVWACVEDLRHNQFIHKGSAMPQHESRDVTWVWSRHS